LISNLAMPSGVLITDYFSPITGCRP
jgi:hypothetical protein